MPAKKKKVAAKKTVAKKASRPARSTSRASQKTSVDQLFADHPNLKTLLLVFAVISAAYFLWVMNAR